MWILKQWIYIVGWMFPRIACAVRLEFAAADVLYLIEPSKREIIYYVINEH